METTQTLLINELAVHVQEFNPETNTKQLPVLVFLHGLAMDSRIWQHQFTTEALPEYRKIAIDIPGHGLSGKMPNPLSDYTLDSLVEVIKEVTRQLLIERYLLVGLSIGGNIAVYAANRLNGCEGILSISVPLSKPLDGQIFANPEFLFGKVYQENLDEETIHKFIELIIPDATKVPVFIRDMINKEDPHFRSALLALVGTGNYEDEKQLIEKSAIPIQIVLGSADPIYNFSYIQQTGYFTSITSCLQWIPDTGHLPQWDNPAKFNQLLERFAQTI